MHMMVEMLRGQRHILSKELGTEDGSHKVCKHFAAPSPARNWLVTTTDFHPDSQWQRRMSVIEKYKARLESAFYLSINS